MKKLFIKATVKFAYRKKVLALDTHWLNIRYKDGMIIKPEELEKELRYPGKVDENILDRIHGSMAGMALGDALGAHVEFRPQAFMEENPVDDLKGGGTWGLEKGQVISLDTDTFRLIQ